MLKVIEVDTTILGYMVYALQKKEINVLNIAVHPQYRRLGIATRMVSTLIDKLSLQRRSKIDLLLREKNFGAQLFFRAQGFRATSVVRGYYEDLDEDAYAMEYDIEKGKQV